MKLVDPADRQHLRNWASAVAELAGEPGDRMLHWDLHYDNVLAAQREPWIAIDPEPLMRRPGIRSVARPGQQVGRRRGEG